MNQIKAFFIKNHTEIIWFLMGWLTLSGLHDLGNGDYIGALISFGLAFINYKLR